MEGRPKDKHGNANATHVIPSVDYPRGLSWVKAAYDQLEPKDRVTVSIGTVALALSALSFVIAIASFRQKTREGRYALRKQLTDTIQKPLELNTEYSRSTLDESKYPRNFGSLINDQRRFHARQAELMTGQIRRLVSKWELMLIGGAYNDIGDYEKADLMFRKAIHSRSSRSEQGTAADPDRHRARNRYV